MTDIDLEYSLQQISDKLPVTTTDDVLVDCTNGRTYATVLHLSSSVRNVL